jgi:twitching motility protein PilU
MDIWTLLKEMVARDGSDLYVTTNSPPLIRVQGVTEPVGDSLLTAAETEALANSLLNEEERKAFRERREMNLGIAIDDLGRFRVNVHWQRNTVGLVVRQIKTEIPRLDDLGLPESLKEILLLKRGLILVTGATGCGKSTTLAAMIGYRNENTRGHIVTVEDPIEFVHPNQGCIVTQREVGADTLSYGEALKNTLRQAPDVILIGEIRDRETMEAAITFADTGHLCLGTLHSSNAYQALQRIMNFFPGDRHAEIYLQLSMNLRAVLSQRLVPGVDGKRVAVMEILRDTPWVKELVKKGEIDCIREAMERAVHEGCQTFDHALVALYESKKISAEEALRNADSSNEVRLRIKDIDRKAKAAAAELAAALQQVPEPSEQPEAGPIGRSPFGPAMAPRRPGEAAAPANGNGSLAHSRIAALMAARR